MRLFLSALIGVHLCPFLVLLAQSPHYTKPMHTAKGTFEVTPKTQPANLEPLPSPLGRMALEKKFTGDLEAASHVEMLTAMTAVKGSAGYVAIEQVTGTLQGRTGSFVLQHSGTMQAGSQQLSVTVVPDSGTGQLTALEGKMTIRIENGKHFYEFTYSIPDSHGE